MRKAISIACSSEVWFLQCIWFFFLNFCHSDLLFGIAIDATHHSQPQAHRSAHPSGDEFLNRKAYGFNSVPTFSSM